MYTFSSYNFLSESVSKCEQLFYNFNNKHFISLNNLFYHSLDFMC
jgi:hypothetical protein